MSTVLEPTDPILGAAYEALSAHAHTHFSLPPKPRRKGGRSELRWALGEGGKPPNPPGAGGMRFHLGVYAYGGATESHGLFASGAHTDAENRSASLSFSHGARKQAPEALFLTVRANGETLSFGRPLRHTLGERSLATADPAGLEGILEGIAAYRDSPESLIARGNADLDALKQVVEPMLDAVDFTYCDYGPDPGGGRPPECTPRRPTAEEVAQAKATFAKSIFHRRELLQTHGAAWNALLKPLYP